jgi:hypothetical protein
VRSIAARLLALALLTGVLGATRLAAAQSTRDASFEWDEAKKRLFVSVSWRDVMDAQIAKKALGGFPTTVVFTATLHRPGIDEPIASTLQSCKIKWLVWDEVYQVERVEPGKRLGGPKVNWKAVLRECGEARRLLAADSTQLPLGVPVYLKAKVQVNPASPELLAKIKRWRSQASATGTAAPGDTLFSTFTGLFLAPIGVADRSLEFTTKTAVPSVPKPKE